MSDLLLQRLTVKMGTKVDAETGRGQGNYCQNFAQGQGDVARNSVLCSLITFPPRVTIDPLYPELLISLQLDYQFSLNDVALWIIIFSLPLNTEPLICTS